MSSLLLSAVGRALGRVVCVDGRADVSNVVFARSASADQRLEISGRFFQLSYVCAGAPLRSGHFCGRPVVHLMSSLLLAVGRATFVWSAGGTFNVVFAIGTTLPTSAFRHFCGRPRLMSSLLGSVSIK